MQLHDKHQVRSNLELVTSKIEDGSQKLVPQNNEDTEKNGASQENLAEILQKNDQFKLEKNINLKR